MQAKGAVSGYVVAAGVFKRQAEHYAGAHSIRLINGFELFTIVKEIRPSLEKSTLQAVKAHSPTLFPECQICHKKMMLRIVSSGDQAGRMFWGCVDLPACVGAKAL